jgi:hypothetical protein
MKKMPNGDLRPSAADACDKGWKVGEVVTYPNGEKKVLYKDKHGACRWGPLNM